MILRLSKAQTTHMENSLVRNDAGIDGNSKLGLGEEKRHVAGGCRGMDKLFVLELIPVVTMNTQEMKPASANIS